MSDRPATKVPVTLRERWPVLAMPALLVVAVSVYSGQFLRALIESPIIAPQQDIPALWVTIMAGIWLVLASLAAMFTSIGTKAAGLTGAAHRRWRLLTLGLMIATWTVIVVLYATDPATAHRWAIWWPVYYEQP